jgi:hypothetical protein
MYTERLAPLLIRPWRGRVPARDPITHYSVLATIEAAYALPRDGQAATATPITNVWLSSRG